MAVGLADLASVRRTTYALFGALFLEPPRPALADVARELRAQEALVSSFSFFPSWAAVLDSVSALDAGEQERLKAEHLQLFRVGSPHPLCPAYESAYLDPSGFERGTLAVEVERAYAAAGVTVSPGELPDHLGLELEFLSILSAEEADAWRSPDQAQALACLRQQAGFLDEHLLRWFPAFVRCVRLAALETSFYRRAAEAVRAFILHDRDLIGALLARTGRTSPEG
jgi:TorA maturation chaperone TorD